MYLDGVEPSSCSASHKRLYKLFKIGGLTEINPPPPSAFEKSRKTLVSWHYCPHRHLILRKRGKQLHGCSVPKSRASRLTLTQLRRMHKQENLHSRRLFLFAISSVCPLLVSYQTTANLYQFRPLLIYKYILLFI